jgi:hypothetical protein
MPITGGQLDQLTISQLVEQLAATQGREAVQLLGAIRKQLGLELFPVISPTVLHTDEWLTRLRAAEAYGGYGDQAAVVGQASHVGLHNPSASTKVALLRTATAFSPVVGEFIISDFGGAPLTNPGFNRALYAGGALSMQASVRHQASAAALGNPLGRVAAPANTTVDLLASLPWIALVPPGLTLLVQHSAANARLVGSFTWTEATR